MNQSVGNIIGSNVSDVNNIKMKVAPHSKTSAVKWITLALVVLLSVAAIVISIVALCSLKNHSFNSDNAILSSISIIVAVLVGMIALLIGWQINNTIEANSKLADIDSKILASFGKYDHAVKAYVGTLEAQPWDFGNSTSLAIDAYFEALNNAIISGNKDALAYTLDKFERFADRHEEKGSSFIFKGRIDKYREILNRLEDKEARLSLSKMLDNAIEHE